ncbi:hypothetical protein AB8A31_16375 [Tardiphaga sp. 804_B3_N1_9]|uniref:hypothetical protein n=1 Tax=Tardiphaga sp. 804_B3_N1_9 TaxID=3240786 RepID=UPI003F20FB2B
MWGTEVALIPVSYFGCGGDSVAILSNEKAAPEGGFLILSNYINNMFGCGDRI